MDIPELCRFLTCALLIGALVAACGCARVGVFDENSATPTVTKTLPVQQTPLPATTATQPPQTLRTLPVPTPSPTTIPVTTPLPVTRGSDATCAGLGGFIVTPGSTCTGEYLNAADTFSCCSVLSTTVIREQLTVTAVPLDLRVNLADDPGQILP